MNPRPFTHIDRFSATHRQAWAITRLTLILLMSFLLFTTALPTHAADEALLLRTFGESDPNYPGFGAQEFTNVNGTLFFAADDGIHGIELWKTNGTSAGTTMVKDIIPGNYGARPSELANVNGILFFSAWDSTSQRYAIWKSDGTTAGTTVVKSFGAVASPTYLQAATGLLYFIIPPDQAVGGFSVWRTDGTTAGTVHLADLYSGSGTQPGRRKSFSTINNRLFFVVAGPNGYEWWKSDGTPESTELIKTWSSNPGEVVSLNNKGFFGAPTDSTPCALWTTDGTAAGTTVVKETCPSTLTKVGGQLFFSDYGNLWRSDGTSAGTVLFKSGLPASADQITDVNGTAFLTFDTYCEIWKSDGSTAGTVLVKEISPYDCTRVNAPAAGNGLFFFRIDTDAIWRSDGTTAGTVATGYSGGIKPVVNDNLFFTKYAANNIDLDLWVLPLNGAVTSTQGTVTPASGTVLKYTSAQKTTTTIAVPANAVTEPTSLLYTSVPSENPPTGLSFANHAFTLDALRGNTKLASFTFEKPISITIQYTDADIAGISETSLKLYYKSGESWIDAATSCTPTSTYQRRPDVNQVTVDVCHLTEFGLFGSGAQQKVYIPAIVR